MREKDEKEYGENTLVLTPHALAYRYLFKDYQKKLTKRSNPYYIRKLFSDDQFNDMDLLDTYSLINEALVAIDRFSASKDKQISRKHIFIDASKNYCKKITIQNILKMATALWNKMIDPLDMQVRLTLDGMLKVFQLKNIALPYARIFFDEIQDASDAMLEMVFQQKHAQQLFAGDRHQAIYQYRYAVDAFSHLESRVDDVYALTQSFRSGSLITDAANKLLSRYTQNQHVLLPKPNIACYSNVIGRPHTLICRNNVTVLKEAIDLIDNGYQVELLNGLKNYDLSKLHELYHLRYGGQYKLLGIYGNLTDFEAVREHAATIKDTDTQLLCRLLDSRGEDLLPALNRLVMQSDPTRQADVVITTAHASKGLEFEAVRLAGDFPALTSELSVAERNLIYVAMTRGMEGLQLPAKIKDNLCDGLPS